MSNYEVTTTDVEDARRRFMDLRIPAYAYMFGFIQADGHLRGSPWTKGSLVVEIQADDEPILRAFAAMTPWASSFSRRTRDTNMASNARSAAWSVFAAECRNIVHVAGIPYGPKSKTIVPPQREFAEVDYYRGLLDGDGSVGITGAGLPFISFGTGSRSLAVAIERFLRRFSGREKRLTPSKREGFFNIVLTKEMAQESACAMYYPGALALPRKAAAAKAMLEWARPAGMRRLSPKRFWTSEEDDAVRRLPIADAAKRLKRTESSVANRRMRLRQGTA